MESQVIVIGTQAYYRLRADLLNVVKEEMQTLGDRLLNVNREADDWISPNQARSLLGVGKTKFQEMKNAGAFKFSQHGRKIRISRKSVLTFLKKNIE